jgi:hypothetical protein
MWRCANEGHARTALSEKKFGKANRHTTSAVSKMPAAFHRVKNNMRFDRPCYDRGKRTEL